ncbi:lipid A deacylase LpxR family protein [Mucilaginibacter sp. HMF5004]|uniref:lipid A deacylase LpxR family protein n=1 Tax=Mucilaginibacter rivuli TaxID=2857527 RepID=UPI001C60035B|nr:lipid A deacylase LpxR family protein [Mucilaginibacter rivuli]MBW4889472.1 lipid A deacylase LpxR family protein [Mucilaginibacter rivuli]
MKLKLLLLLLSVCSLQITIAQNRIYRNEAGYKTDNDGLLFRGSDRYYTAGNFFYYRRALKVKDSVNISNKILGFELGQKIYTPQSAALPGPQYIDRPFAGYLYIAPSLNLLYNNESNLKLEAQLGIVGPHAIGEQVQDLIHNTFHFYAPKGWEYQINNDPEINLSAKYNRLLIRRRGVDVLLNTHADLGTGIIGAGAGFTARFGKFNPLYHSVTTQSTLSATKTTNNNNRELFFYAKPLISFVGYDATIQGSIFKKYAAIDEIENDKTPVVLAEQLGANLVSGHWILDVSATYQTRTTKQMVHKPGHQWGSLSVLYRF